jgi:hypothetical protein
MERVEKRKKKKEKRKKRGAYDTIHHFLTPTKRKKLRVRVRRVIIPINDRFLRPHFSFPPL